jgi:hypothetical protein
VYALIGRVEIKPGRADEAMAMIDEYGARLLAGMDGSSIGYWARTIDPGELIQHSFWVFDTEEHARSAKATFETLRDTPDAPATFIAADVCQVIGHADSGIKAPTESP